MCDTRLAERGFVEEQQKGSAAYPNAAQIVRPILRLGKKRERRSRRTSSRRDLWPAAADARRTTDAAIAKTKVNVAPD